MWWVIGAIGVLAGIGFMNPSSRAREIAALSPLNRKWYGHTEAKEARVLPRAASDRDVAYMLEYYKRFGANRFSYGQVRGKRLSRNLMDTFDVRSGPLDDKTVLGSRLPELGLLTSPRPGVYQLTEAAVELVKRQIQSNAAL